MLNHQLCRFSWCSSNFTSAMVKPAHSVKLIHQGGQLAHPDLFTPNATQIRSAVETHRPLYQIQLLNPSFLKTGEGTDIHKRTNRETVNPLPDPLVKFCEQGSYVNISAKRNLSSKNAWITNHISFLYSATTFIFRCNCMVWDKTHYSTMFIVFKCKSHSSWMADLFLA